MNAHAIRYPVFVLALFGAMLLWQAPAWAKAPRRDAPVVSGPAPAGQPGSSGPLVMYVGNSPLRRATHARATRSGGRSGRHGHDRFADSSR